MKILLQMIITIAYSFISGLEAFGTAFYQFKPLYDTIGDVKNMAIAEFTGLPLWFVVSVSVLISLIGTVKWIYNFVTDSH